ncbi:MAG: LamG-like jellyroll fold domain-containing protein, partial [Solirubrobacterales bacterium]
PYGEYFQGLIDEVRVYDRALTQADVQADMNSPVPGS